MLPADYNVSVNCEAYIILHNIRSAANAGAIFRTADAVGIQKIYLSGYSPTPIDRFGRVRRDFAKTALGAEKSVPFEYRREVAPLLQKLKRKDVKIVAVEQAKNATDYKKFYMRGPTAFVFGNEVRGISRQLLKNADSVIYIPMRGEKESLNVSVAAGIILFRILDN